MNYLGFTTRKLGDFEAGEKYYLLGLQVEPNHVGINEYLGELYVVTNRIDLAKERLEVLKSCNCEEYQELKEIIDGSKNQNINLYFESFAQASIRLFEETKQLRLPQISLTRITEMHF